MYICLYLCLRLCLRGLCGLCYATCTCITLNMSSGWEVMRVPSAASTISNGCFSMLRNQSMTCVLIRSKYSLQGGRGGQREGGLEGGRAGLRERRRGEEGGGWEGG